MIQKYILKATTEFDSKSIQEYLALLPDSLLQKINSYTLIEKKNATNYGFAIDRKNDY